MRWWIKLLAALLAIVLLAGLAWRLVSSLVGVLNGADMSFGEADPMFAEEMEIPTRPPELDAEEEVPQRPTLDDLPMPEGAPVDKTADELIREARQGADS